VPSRPGNDMTVKMGGDEGFGGFVPSLSLFLRGILAGIAIAVPVGPVGILCLRRSLIKGPVSGLISGLGAASADAIFGLIAAFGLTAISDFLLAQAHNLRLAGGALLCVLGIRNLLRRTARLDADAASRIPNGTRLGEFASTFAITITNPITILAFAAIFAALGAIDDPSIGGALSLVGGVIAGSGAWWLLLTGLSGLFRRRLDPYHLEWMERLAGVLLLGFGLFMLATRIWPDIV